MSSKVKFVGDTSDKGLGMVAALTNPSIRIILSESHMVLPSLPLLAQDVNEEGSGKAFLYVGIAKPYMRLALYQ